MKYIRTKDGIYLNGGKFGKPYAGIVGKKREIDFGYCFDKKDIINQADTIEELCDRFVLITNRAHYGFGHFSNIKRVVLGKEEKFIACYGAIWTDKGLIYVAKMNNKGELELL